MIRTIDIDINAANPNMPLAPFQAFVTSPSSVRIRNVPRKIGAWEITGVALAVNYPDNTLRTAVCKLTAGVWVGTVVGSASVGQSVNGYAIIASGTDENGNGITGYILGKGDVLILSTDGTITIGETTYYVHLVDTQPTAPKKGDICKISGVYKVYTGTVWESLSGVSSVSWDDITGKPSTFSPSAHASSHGSTGTDPITPASIGAEPTISDLATIRSGAASGATAYQLPSGGIPSTDLTAAVQTSLEKADTAFQPSEGGQIQGTTNFNAFADFAGGMMTSSFEVADGEVFSSVSSSLTFSTGYPKTSSTLTPDGSSVVTATTQATAIAADVTHAKSISASGVSAACTPDTNGNVDVSTLFTSANTSLTSTIGSTIAARCQSLDPANSSISDVIKALKGIN